MQVIKIVVGVALLLATVVLYTEACSCMPTHPQQHYCSSDFVILARVKRERELNGTNTRMYKVRIRKEYKMSEKATVALKGGRLLTPSSDSMCGIQLQVGQLYVLSGRVVTLRAHIYLCNMAEKWQNVTKRQRKGLRKMYLHGCTCKIANCLRKKRCVRKKDSCNWTSSCHAKQGICLRGQSGSCIWSRNAPMKQCLKNETLTISRWSG